MGTKVLPDDVVRVGRKVVSPRRSEVILFNKPRGLVCSASDELGRETIYDALPQKYQHLKNVGRLDKDSEGIIVLTNDGELAQTLTHPRKKIEKEYLVTLDQTFGNEVLEKLLAGVHTPEGRLTAKSVKRVSSRRVRMVLTTGVKRQIRIMFEAVHLKVTKLVRIRIGSLMGNALEVGKCHLLDEEDIEALKTNPKERHTGRFDSGDGERERQSTCQPKNKPTSSRKPSSKPAPYMPAKKKSSRGKR
jgi:23S rRNA pseudouridine2605 synthase